MRCSEPLRASRHTLPTAFAPHHAWAAPPSAVAYADGSLTASVARAGSFRGAALKVAVGTNAATLTAQLRLIGIFTEGPIVAPAAAAMPTEEPAQA